MINTLVVLAGGLGTRLYPLTKNIPKILIDIEDKKFLEIQYNLYKKKGIKNFIYLCQHYSNQIREFCEKKNFNNTLIVDDGFKRLGTGGSLKKNINLLPNDFYLTYGDSYLDYDLSKIEKKYTYSNKCIMTLYSNKDINHKNNVLVKNGEIIKIDKINNYKFNYIDYGLFLFNKKLVKRSMMKIKKKNFDLSLIIQILHSKSLLDCSYSKKKFQEIGSFKGIEQLKKTIKGKS